MSTYNYYPASLFHFLKFRLKTKLCIRVEIKSFKTFEGRRNVFALFFMNVTKEKVKKLQAVKSFASQKTFSFVETKSYNKIVG